MARTAITLNTLAESTFTTKPTATSFAAADGASIDVSGNTEGVLLRFEYSASGSAAKGFTVKAGTNPPAFRAGVGDLDMAISGSAGATSKDLAIEDSARFIQSDGKIYIDCDAVVTAAVSAIRLPK
jgi:hypothetical protein